MDTPCVSGNNYLRKSAKSAGGYHDASGNVMCIYTRHGDTLTAGERPIYGSKRLGELRQQIILGTNGSLLRYDNATIGFRHYELTDHLGNVMAVVSDRKMLSPDSVYYPVVITATDYYPFGYPIPDRSSALGGYRYGFNGQESDDEVYGEKQSYTAEFWQYDSRLGRRWNVDPEMKPDESPYIAFADDPIIIIDPNGRDSVFVNRKGEIALRIPNNKIFRTFIQTTNSASIENLTKDWASVPMPNIIQTRTQSGENVSGAEYQQNDYLIAARTGYFNQAKNAGTLKLYTQGGNAVPQDFVKSIPDLNPTLVKAMTIQESHNGVTGITDILQVNNIGDWGIGKSKYGMTKGENLSVTNSLYYGIRWLSSKGIKVTYNAETKQYEYSFKGWENAIGAYNGGGTINYQNYVKQMKNESKKPTPTDY